MPTNYRVPVLEKFSWQPPVKSILSIEPLTPLRGDRYIIGPSASGTTWAGNDNKIATCSDAIGPTWLIDAPSKGWQAMVENLTEYYYFDGTTWLPTISIGKSGYSGYSGISGFSGSPGTLIGITYYTDDQLALMSGGPKRMLRAPDADPETQYSVIGTGLGTVIETFLTNINDPDVNLITNGVWQSNLWAYTDTSGGTNQIVVNVYKWNPSGPTQTLLFSFDPVTITDVGSPTAFVPAISVQGDIALATTDRLLFEYVAYSDVSGKTISLCVGGSSHFTHVHTPLISQGYSGFSGWSGYSGQVGSSGYSGYSGYSGGSGYSGYSGPSGYSGYSGPSGYSGYSGESGYSGYSGDSGYSGYSGVSGYSGYSGESGYSGYSGESGYSGYSGYSGISGYSGYSGESGYSGYSGESGYSGYSGESGYSGYSGDSGYSGYSGDSGYSGYSGFSGYSGYSGESGYSGYSGPSGYSGYSGFSGFSGSPGTLVGITYYTDDQNSDVGTDKRMLRAPDADPEVQYAAIATLSGTVIKEFTTILGDPGQNLITNGTWQSNLWAYVDSSGGANTIVCNVYKTDPTGPTKTLLFSFDPVTVTDVGSPTAFLPSISVQGDLTLATTDRLTFEYIAYSDVSGKTITLCVGGSSHFSHVHTPLITQGYSGISGYSGQVGTSGYSGYSGESGYSGYSGPSGYSGYSGESGYSGYSGESGYSGYSGPSGYSGYSGESGYSGYSGESGYSGYSGISGYSGYSGESGYSGYSGVSGYSGYSGESGYSGYSGQSGYSGYSGESGYSGYSGPSGYSGYSGESGYSGYSGESGYSGYSGYSGTSGYSGYSGFSGYSGPGAQYDTDYMCLIIGG
jgi:hypothetical protein